MALQKQELWRQLRDADAACAERGERMRVMGALRDLLKPFKRKPKTPEQIQREAEALEAQRNFELSKAQYRPR